MRLILPLAVLLLPLAAQAQTPTPTGQWMQPDAAAVAAQQTWQAGPAQTQVPQQQQIINQMRAGTYQPQSRLGLSQPTH